MKSHGITRTPFSPISNDSLDELVKDHKTKQPNAGIRYIRGALFTKKLRVQRHRIISSLGRVDVVAKVARRDREIKCGEYYSPRPNAVWHLDGHHKLGPWGIVIHGISDGYDRLVSASNLSLIHGVTTVFRFPICKSPPTILHRQFYKSLLRPFQNGGVLIVHGETVAVKMFMSQRT